MSPKLGPKLGCKQYHDGQEFCSNLNWKGREIVWRSRAKESAKLIAKIIKSKETPEKERPKYFRALDFQSPSQRDEALLEILQDDS